MSISSIMQIGLTALTANQQALKTTSTNVANVNTPGYSRLSVDFLATEFQGNSAGVQVDVNRVADAYLAAADMRGSADSAAADVQSQFMTRAQALLGDPTSSGSVFAQLDPALTSFSSLSVDPSSAVNRTQSVSSVQTLLSQINATSSQISSLRDETNTRVIADIQQANSLMTGIAKLNTTLQAAAVSGGTDPSASTQQQAMLDQLSKLMDIRVQARPLGGVDVRTSDGVLLVDTDAAQLAQSTTSNGAAYPGTVLTPARSTTPVPMDNHIQGGELRGLLTTRDSTLVDLQKSFSEYAAGAADALNAAHNAASSLPPPTQLTGVNRGLLATDRLSFTGATNIAIVGADGTLSHNYRVDFGAGTITDENNTVTNFANSIGDFQTALNTAMGSNGTASFASGSLQLTTSVANSGLAVTDDPTNPAMRAGQGFSQTFGLNNLVASGGSLNYATGLSGADLSGFTAGQTVNFALRNATGAITKTVNFTVGAGSTIASLRSDIDTALSGYAQTNFDAQGRLTITPTSPSVKSVDVLQDSTQRGDTGLSLSQIFGLGDTVPAQRALGLSVRSDIAANPSVLSAAVADLAGAAVGAQVLAPGDGRGAQGLANAGSTVRTFAAAGGLPAQTSSLTNYAATVAGAAGGQATSFANAKSAADAVQTEASTRRQSSEGVNLDEELVNMTTYQQAYSAASRMITAAKDMYDVLLNMVQ